MNIYDFIGQKITNPISSKNVPDLKKQWDEAREICDKNLTMKSGDGRKSMTFTQLYYVPG